MLQFIRDNSTIIISVATIVLPPVGSVVGAIFYHFNTVSRLNKNHSDEIIRTNKENNEKIVELNKTHHDKIMGLNFENKDLKKEKEEAKLQMLQLKKNFGKSSNNLIDSIYYIGEFYFKAYNLSALLWDNDIDYIKIDIYYKAFKEARDNYKNKIIDIGNTVIFIETDIDNTTLCGRRYFSIQDIDRIQKSIEKIEYCIKQLYRCQGIDLYQIDVDKKEDETV